VSSDLSPAESHEVGQHVAGCPACQRQAGDLTSTSEVLSGFSEAAHVECRKSVWPGIAGQLSEIDSEIEFSQSLRYGVLAGASLATAALLCVAVWVVPGQMSPLSSPTYVVPIADQPTAPRASEFVPVYSDPTWEALERLKSTPYRTYSPEIRHVRVKGL